MVPAGRAGCTLPDHVVGAAEGSVRAGPRLPGGVRGGAAAGGRHESGSRWRRARGQGAAAVPSTAPSTAPPGSPTPFPGAPRFKARPTLSPAPMGVAPAATPCPRARRRGSALTLPSCPPLPPPASSLLRETAEGAASWAPECWAPPVCSSGPGASTSRADGDGHMHDETFHAAAEEAAEYVRQGESGRQGYSHTPRSRLWLRRQQPP